MIAKLLLAAALVAVPVSASAPPVLASPIPLVVCPVSDGMVMGTAFRIGPKLLISVNHVTSYSNCSIDGEKIKVVYASPKADFSILSLEKAGRFLSFDCEGFVAGRKYVAIGHPRGIEELVAVPMTATDKTVNGLALLYGVFTAQPGHSGGPIVDAETLKVVGTVNTGDWEEGLTGSVELKGTPICQH